ncbi:MAG: insulinase family protein [Gemmatimonadetes bacterium]|nr:insulinase family protein [Gemmatimonadota bacterium]
MSGAALLGFALALQAVAASPPQSWTGGLAVSTWPSSPIVAVVVGFPGGAADDPRGEEGLTYVMADAIARSAEAAASARAAFLAQVTREAVWFSLLAPSDAWVPAYQALTSIFYGPEIPAPHVAAARATLLSRLAAEAHAPPAEVENEAFRAFFGSEHAWARPPAGLLETVERLSATRVQERFSGRFRPEQATTAVVGPVERAEVEALVMPAPTRPAAARTAVAGVRPGRVALTREVTSTWVATAYPLNPATPALARGLLAHYLEAEWNMIPRDPALFEAVARIEPGPVGDILVVRAAVAPEAAEPWERRILDTIERLGAADLSPPVFQAALGSYRSALSLQLASPENMAQARAEGLMRAGRASDPLDELRALTPAMLTAAVRTLGQPAVLIYGPNLSR